jgi:hypothetical protein
MDFTLLMLVGLPRDPTGLGGRTGTRHAACAFNGGNQGGFLAADKGSAPSLSSNQIKSERKRFFP